MSKMPDEILLNGMWELQDNDINANQSVAQQLSHTSQSWFPTPVPGDIHQGLIAAGKIKEPLIGTNSFDCQWTENRSWWFRKVFQIEPQWRNAEVIELELNGLDSNAQIFLNGNHVGSHKSSFCPFVADVKKYLQDGENVLLVRLTVGTETVSQQDVDSLDGVIANSEANRGRPERGDARRPFVRKPQYSFGWDWSPRLATTAINGDVKIRFMNKACIRNVYLNPSSLANLVEISATVVVDLFHYYKTEKGHVTVKFTAPDGKKITSKHDVLLCAGENFVTLNVTIEDPLLWWPNGLGEQNLYKVDAEVVIDDFSVNFSQFEYGIRFVELQTLNSFHFVINGKKVFCKGANWIPADTIYARVTDEKYDMLVQEARKANFNMFRVWGGGLYERDAFYKACQRYGIMIWHDFMFACAPYPDRFESFQKEVEKEADYQTKRLQHNASVVLWCGNNEIHWLFQGEYNEKTKAGAWIYNYLLPNIVRKNCPQIPYWNSSPYGGSEPNDETVGDFHAWFDYALSPVVENRVTPQNYDNCKSYFISEYGYIGAPVKETILDYLGGAPLKKGNQVWEHHNNTWEHGIVDAGIGRNYTDSKNLTIDEYLLYSGLCQGLMYSYAIDAMRFRANCNGSLFWMFNDCWGEIGWAIVDYYLRRKISWYFVRRAYALQRLILRKQNDKITIAFVNESHKPVRGTLEYGYYGLDGKKLIEKQKTIDAPAESREVLVSFTDKYNDTQDGVWFARIVENTDILPGILKAGNYYKLKPGVLKSKLKIVSNKQNEYKVSIKSDTYLHAVHLILPPKAIAEDDYFDILPGQTYTVKINSKEKLTEDNISVTCFR